MKRFLCALAVLAATVEPSFAGVSCWSSSDGNQLLVPPGDFAITYKHGGLVEPCNRMLSPGPASWRIWCDVSAVSGILKLVSARHSPNGQAVVLWDDQVFYRDDQCPWGLGVQ